MANIKSYDSNSKIQLTKNINIRELKCKGSGHIHNTKVDLDHINKIQEFMAYIGATKVIFSRCYSCKEHNSKIGGSRNSQHLISCATDQCFYKDGKIIPAKEVCCKAQDYGFKGIAYINANYVHLDSRANGTYRGDETKGYSNNVPNGDFYTYFGIKKDDKSSNTYNGTFPTLPSRGYFKKGDRGAEVKNLQALLNWLNGSKLVVDGILGDKTIKQVKVFQKSVKIVQDGLFGRTSLEKAKQVRK